jgi:GAF domain-containing protein
MNTVSADSSFSSETIDVSKGRSASQRFGIAAEEGCVKPTIVNTSDLAAVSPYMCDVVLAEGLKAVCLLPLVNRGRALGMLGIGRIGESAFTPSDVEFLTRVSGQIAIALENALAYQEISDLKDRLAEEKLYLEEEIRSESATHARSAIGGRSLCGSISHKASPKRN